MNNFLIELGSVAQSRISKFKGTVTSRSEHMNGCNRYWLEPTVDKEGKTREGAWFDEVELDVIEKPKAKRQKRDTGGFPSKIK
jgi:hypothetical protein